MRNSNVKIRNAARAALALAVLALVMTGVAAPLAAQAPADARWVPWLGCWESVAPQGQPAGVPARICVHATPGQPGVTFASLVGGKVVSSRDVVADGSRRAVSEGGCRGWESDSWSRDARRVFRREELDCDGGVKRIGTGVIALLPDDRWVDIDAAGPAGARGVRVQRFRPMSTSAALATGLMPVGEDLAIRTSRTAASGPLLAADVVEAAGRVDPEVVQALVYERGNGYDLDAKAVQRLADARVPTDVIDLMVALSYPDFFTIDRGLQRVALRDNGSGGSGRQPRGGGWGGYPCYDRYYDRYYGSGYGYLVPGWIYSYPIGYGYSSYGYYDPCYGPYGGGYWGGGYWGGGYYPGGVIVGRGNGSTGGRVVKGGGYERPDGASTRGTAKPKSGSGSAAGRGSSGSSGGSGGSTARGSGGATSTGRTAHPRNK